MSDGGSRLRLGMVGGGRGAFIGEAHRIAARLDDRYELVAGALGAVRVEQVEFALGWLSGPSERDSKQAAWRTDPAQAGASFIVADLGTHCFHLSEFVTGRRTVELAADLQTMVPGRRLEDNAHILMRFDNGARGAMWVSAVAAGEQVGLRLRVYGEEGHIAWEQSDPDKLTFALQSEASRTLLRGQNGMSPAAKRATRIVAGLPEGYFEAFATLYRDYADILVARQGGRGTRSVGAVGADGRGWCPRHGVR
jgi:predicted dehydrogenase